MCCLGLCLPLPLLLLAKAVTVNKIISPDGMVDRLRVVPREGGKLCGGGDLKGVGVIPRKHCLSYEIYEENVLSQLLQRFPGNYDLFLEF